MGWGKGSGKNKVNGGETDVRGREEREELREGKAAIQCITLLSEVVLPITFKLIRVKSIKGQTCGFMIRFCGTVYGRLVALLFTCVATVLV